VNFRQAARRIVVNLIGSVLFVVVGLTFLATRWHLLVGDRRGRLLGRPWPLESLLGLASKRWAQETGRMGRRDYVRQLQVVPVVVDRRR
jgi:hypothetical protein